MLRPELTAMRRTGLSSPARQAIEDGMLNGSVLDYGCGRGGDVARLAVAGLDVHGWDPHYRSEPPPRPADTVLCSYVLNVVENPVERLAAARRAWELARQRLIVAVRTTADRGSVIGPEHGDGTLTCRSTFHHLFWPGELRTVLFEATGRQAVTVRPGLAYVFRDDDERVALLARRYGSNGYADDPDGQVLARIVAFFHAKGRRPEPEEQPRLWEAAAAAYGDPRTAFAAARAACDAKMVASAASTGFRELLVVLALAAFHGSRKASSLPPETAADARAYPGGRRAAVKQADRMLYAAGRPEEIRAAVRRSPVGKTSPTALYVHTDAEAHLPPLLRVYAACSEFVVGRPQGTTLVKLHTDKPAVSFLAYPDFDRNPHPRLHGSVIVDLRQLDARHTDWSGQVNRPLLHRKEEFLHPSDERFAKFRRLTMREIAAGLYAEPERIGREHGWEQVLAEAGLALRGHRLVMSPAAAVVTVPQHTLRTAQRPRGV